MRPDEELFVETQYNDLKGQVAIDGHGTSPLHQLAKRCGLPEGCLAVGLSLYYTTEGGRAGMVEVRFLVVDREHVSAAGGDVPTAQKLCGYLPVFFSEAFHIPLADFFQAVKRLDLKALSKTVRRDALNLLPNH
jgi:hypothetical protein